ncbi:uncharacterized protein J8A68_000361 [[Candida] subhashii]|uniref:Uncharacterized protein n=1 Tax=[Candida] subhashii TaxID=561895 RepID=A0A8J5QX40_9ASCO|nr:uncharacterized protein J8A68_000361 [[Candida] subhashii]KAG7666105.1 hypothetical protein J8A68_000361 [[Candida] subhashii]
MVTFIVLVGIVVIGLIYHKQLNAFILHYYTTKPSTSIINTNEKSSYAKDTTANELPKPTPLMITPDQVKNYDDRPWRPFRWPYHQTMSIFKLDINHWLDMDKYYVHYLEEKERIWKKFDKECYDWLPESYDACFELMETVVEHMCVRYPFLFTVLNEDAAGEGEGGKIVRNEVTSEVLDMRLPLKEHPFVYISKLAKEDFYIVQQNPKDGLHYLVAAAVPFPGGSFEVAPKLGKPLDIIHGEVPYYKEKLQNSMEKWFGKLQVNEPVERASWNITMDHKLKMSDLNQDPKVKPNIKEIMESTDPTKFGIRIERQALRRLPKTKAIIFSNHPIYYSLEEMKDEPMIPSLIKKIMYEGPEKILEYKKFPFVRDHLVEYLDYLIKRQIELGIIKEDTPIKTQPSYPFAHWVKTDFDFVNGWNNPGSAYDKGYNFAKDFDSNKLADNE